jgi:tyrosine-protein kinase Etk/Wzc
MIPTEMKSKFVDRSINDYLRIIVRRKWIILLFFLSTLLSTVYFVDKIEDIYESSSTIVIEEPTTYLKQQMMGNVRSLSFYEGILSSRSFLETVLDTIGLTRFQTVFPKMSREEAVQYIHQSISLRKTIYTSFLKLNVRMNSSDLAYVTATRGTEIFRNRCHEVASEESRRALLEIDKQLNLIRKNLEQAEQDYRHFSEKAGQIHEGTTKELKALQDSASVVLAQLGVKEADLDAEKKLLLQMESKITPAVELKSSEYLALRTKLKELEKEKLRLEGLGIRLTGISTIDREIKETENLLLEYKKSSSTGIDPATMRQWQETRKSVIAKESELELFKRRLEAYNNAIKAYKSRNPNVMSQSLELLRLKRSKEVYENIYSILLEKAEEQRIVSASNTAGVKIVDMPVLPDKPIPKNEMRYYLLGAILGLALGMALAFFIEFNDTTIKSNEDIERFLMLPVMGTIPHITHDKKSEVRFRRKNGGKSKGSSLLQYPKQVFNFDGDDSVITESYRSLRTNLTFVSPDKPLKAIVLTSAGPSEGKSLTTSNLATAYAQMGKKTLLVDTDLRRPVIHHIFNCKREPGFTDLFGENPDLDQIIHPTDKENLFIIPAGVFTPNPAELIGSNKMTQIIEKLKESFDIIFFDSPPIVAVTDSTLLGTKTDGILIIIKSNHTEREIASRAINILKNVNVRILGTVLNDIDLTHRYSSYGYYKYYYHYYKSKKG